MADERPLRVAFLCRSTSTLPRWQAKAVRQVLAIPKVQLVAVGIPRTVASASHSSGIRGKLEARMLNVLYKVTSTPEDVSDLLGSVPIVELRPEGASVTDIDKLALHEPDLVFSFLPLLPSKHQVKDLSIWQFAINERSLLNTGLPSFGPHLLNARSVSVALLNTNEQHALKLEIPMADANGTKGIDSALSAAAWLPAHLITARRTGIGSNLISNINTVDDQPSMLNIIRSALYFEIHRLSRNNALEISSAAWNIGILHQPITSLLNDDSSMNVRWLPSPALGNHRMEPFGFTAADGQLNVLYRKKSQNKPYDLIARLRPKSENVLKRSRSMLSTQGNLEYPFVIERPDGAYSIISYPHQGRTELFKVASTNDGLDHVKVLMDKAINSPTLIQHEARWWLFGTDPETADNVLLAFYSDHFDGPYTPHTLNPIKMDSVGVRPAGTFFRNGTELWRPALDSTGNDAMAVILNRVEELTPTSFREVAGKRIAGFRGSVYGHGVRTLAAMGDITLIDGVRLAGSRKPEKAKRKKERRSSSEDE